MAQPRAVETARLIPILHADDCGVSAGTTDAIMACHDHGWLQRTSVVVNGAGWDHAVDALRRRPELSVFLHLNLFEGRPLSDAAKVDLLVDRRGRFNRGFARLLLQGYTGGGATRRLRAQVRLELRQQIERFLDAFGDRGALLVDGHVHYHMLPLVFDELLALSAEYAIDAIRLPRELLYWPAERHAPRPPLINVVKNVVLRSLSSRAESALAPKAVQTTDAFIGVLATGAMTLEHVIAALNHLRSKGTCGTVEILFHPGRARPEEAALWADRPQLRAFYLSPSRDREAELLCSDALLSVLRQYGERPSRAATLPPCEVSA